MNSKVRDGATDGEGAGRGSGPRSQSCRGRAEDRVPGPRAVGGGQRIRSQVPELSKAIFLHMPFVKDKVLTNMNCFVLILLLYLGSLGEHDHLPEQTEILVQLWIPKICSTLNVLKQEFKS